MKTPYVFFHRDLDGIVSFLVLCWTYDQKLPYCDVPNAKHLKGLLAPNLKTLRKNHEPIFVVDLDTRELEDSADLIIFDHHDSNTNKGEHVNQDASSCSKLIYKWATKEMELVLTPEQKLLVALANDYDSWEHKIPQSSQLSIVFHRSANKVETFIENYWEGFKEFSSQQKQILDSYNKDLQTALENIRTFETTFSVQGKQRHLVSLFCSDFVNECMEEALKVSGAEIAFGIHPSAQRVFIRKTKGSDANLEKIAVTLLDGGGHKDAAGGVITDKFLEFTKLFS